MKIYLIASIFFMSCSFLHSKHVIRVTNASEVTVDSVIVSVSNKYKVKFDAIDPGEQAKEIFYAANTGHDITYIFKVFVKDSLKSDKFFFSNDLGYYPPEFKVRITRNFILELDTLVTPRP